MNNRMALLTSPFVPDGMVDLMKKLSKAVIKERPSNIYEYAADFFEKMLIERDGSLDKGYGKFRSYTEYCKFMDKMDQRRLKQPTEKEDIINIKYTNDYVAQQDGQDETIISPNFEVQGVAIQGVERKSRDSVKNVSINPKYKSQSEKGTKPYVSNAKKPKPRKLSSKKPSENLIVIKEETSADVDDNGNGECKMNRAAATIQKAFRKYLSRKNSQDEQVAQASGNVSQLSEDAAAIIIQKAFKSLIQKLKLSTHNGRKIDEESNNNNVLMPIAGQEHDINVNEITNNIDENPVQIACGDEQKDIYQDSEHASGDTALSLENGMNQTQLATNLESVTASNTTPETQRTENKEIQIDDTSSGDSVSDHKIALASDNVNENVNDELVKKGSQESELSIPSEQTDYPVAINTETNDPVEPKENETVNGGAVDPEVEPVQNETEEKRSDHSEENENQKEIVSDESPKLENNAPFEGNTETNEDQLSTGTSVTTTEQEFKSNVTSNADIEGTSNEKVSKELEKAEIAAPMNVTEPSVGDINVTISEEENIVPSSELQDESASQLEERASAETETKTTELSENIPASDPNVADDNNAEEDFLPTENELVDHTGEKIIESSVNKKLFVVDKSGVYVNMDKLQEKFGTTAIDDGTGSDSEKTFKLNILEREEILVNQENYQQIEKELLNVNSTSSEKSEESTNITAVQSEEVAERVDNGFAKDEEGNEEYELAETVVLVDIPSVSKTNRESEPLHLETMTMATETKSFDTMKPNRLVDESNDQMIAVDEIRMEKRSVSLLENHANEEITPKNVDSEVALSTKTQVDEVEHPEHQLNKNEDDHSIPDENKVKEHDEEIELMTSQTGENVIATHEEKAEIEKIVEDQSKESESKTVNSQQTEELVRVVEDEEANNRNVEHQSNENAVVVAIPDSEKSLTEENGIDEVDMKHDDQLNNVNDVTIGEDLVVNVDEEKIQIESLKNVDVLSASANIEPAQAEDTCDSASARIGPAQAEDTCDSHKIFNNKENEDLVKAVTIIQKVFRGYIVRNSETSRIDSKKNQLELSAALTIQKYVRGYLVRRNMQKIDKLITAEVTSIETKQGDNEPIITESAAPLPAYSNRFLIPKDSFLERESFADDEDYARTCKELAATSIQKTYRGYRVRRSLKASSETDAETTDDVNHNEIENGIQSVETNNQVQTVVTEAERVISAILNVATDVLPQETYGSCSFEEDTNDEKSVQLESKKDQPLNGNGAKGSESVLGQIVQDNIHVEGQMQQKYNQISFQGSPTINPIDEMSDDSSEQPETPRVAPVPNPIKSSTFESNLVESKSFSYEQLSSDLSDSDENKRESLKDSEMDETSRDERDDLSEVENFDLSSCGEDSLEAMYYSIRKSEIMLDRMHKQVSEQREPKSSENGSIESAPLKVEFPGRVTENLDVAMQQVFKSMESSSDCDGDKKDEDDNSSTLDLGLDDSSSVNDDEKIETSRQIKRSEKEMNVESNEESNVDVSNKNGEVVRHNFEFNVDRRDVEVNKNDEQSQQSDASNNSSTRFIVKSQSVSEDMMNPIMFAMKRKQALLDQMHVRPYPLEENLSEDHDAFPEHLLTDIDIGNIQRKIFASSISETDSDYVEPTTTTSRRLVRDDFNISTALDHLSTDSDSTIVSAATKIQAGARGFLTRRRLRRSSAGGTSISFEKRYSFGNAAIDKSLEDLIKMQEQINLDGAAMKIQQQYRRYQARKKNLKKVSPIREQTTLELSGGSSIDGAEGTENNIGITEVTLAQKKVDDDGTVQSVEEENEGEKITDTHPISLNVDTVETVKPVKQTPVNQRRLTLQRGDAVHCNSRPDSQESNLKDGNHASGSSQGVISDKSKDSETGEFTEAINSKQERKVTANINIQSLINRGIGPRQRSMPVQIDSELMRILPKHLRKRVKSADIAKKKSNN